MKRQCIVAIIIILCIIQSGCWSRKELNRISIISASAIDLANDGRKLIFTIQLINPGALGKGEAKGKAEQPFYVAASSGLTLADAERNLYKHVTRPLFWQHMRVIIISEKLARTKLDAVVDYLDRIAAFRRKMLLLVTSGEARETLMIEPPVENLAGQAIYNLAQETMKHSAAYSPSDINDYLIALSTPGIEPLLARLEIKPGEKSESPDSGQAKIEGRMTKEFELSGCAVFKREKMVGWFNGEETKGLLWVREKTQNVMIVLRYPGSPAGKDLITVLNQRIHSEIRPEFSQGKLRVKVAIQAQGRFVGQSFIDRDATQPNALESLDRQYAAAIQRNIKMALVKAQNEYGSDVFGFGLAISRRYPALWKKIEPRWEEEFRRLDVDLNVTAQILRMGLTLKPTQRE